MSEIHAFRFETPKGKRIKFYRVWSFAGEIRVETYFQHDMMPTWTVHDSVFKAVEYVCREFADVLKPKRYRFTGLESPKQVLADMRNEQQALHGMTVCLADVPRYAGGTPMNPVFL